MESIVVNNGNLKEFLSEGTINVLDFWAPWCGPCRTLNPIIEELATNNENIKVGKVDVDESGVVAAAYGIRTIPTIIFFKDGKPISRISGVQPLVELQKIIENL